MIAFFVFTMLRFSKVPYLWYFYKCLDIAKRYQWPIIAQEDYFQPPTVLAADGQAAAYDQKMVDYRFQYAMPKKKDLQKITKYVIPNSMEERLFQEMGSYNDAFCHLLTARYEPFESLIGAYLDDMRAKSQEPIEAVMTLCHYPSLSAAAEQRGIPVLHMEQGTFREPSYLKTAFFDFDDLYGGKTLERRWNAFKREQERRPTKLLDRKEILAVLLDPKQISLLEKRTIAPTYRAGAALGYCTWELFNAKTHLNDNEILFRLSDKYGKANISVRKHPADPYGAQYPQYAAVMDDKKNTTIDFILSCESIATMGSNVAMEAMYWGRKAWVMVPCPSYFAGEHEIEKDAKSADDTYLSFFALCYLVPYGLCFDIDYIRWRLTGPTEKDIYARHLSYYLEEKQIQLSDVSKMIST